MLQAVPGPLCCKLLVGLEHSPQSHGNQSADRVGNKGVDAIAAVYVAWHGIVVKWRSRVEEVFNVNEDLVTTQPSVLEVVGSVRVESDVSVHVIAAYDQGAI